MKRFLFAVAAAWGIWWGSAWAGPVQFGPPQLLDRQSGQAPSWLKLADLNDDGRADILALLKTRDGGLFSAWYENRGAGKFLLHTPEKWDLFHNLTDVADIDGDGDTDLLYRTNRQVTWAEKTSRNPLTFTNHALRENYTDGRGMAQAVDLDVDGDRDILVSDPDAGGLVWLKNNGARPPTFSAVKMGTGTKYESFTVGDLNKDGRLDIFARTYSWVFAWFQNNGPATPAFTVRTLPVQQTHGRIDYWIGDVNGDGYNGVLLLASQSGAGLMCYENSKTNPPTFTFRELDKPSLKFDQGQAADLDGDGDLDVVIQGRFTYSSSDSRGSIYIYENKSTKPPSFTLRTLWQQDTGTYDSDFSFVLAAADVTGDHKPDLIQGHQWDSVVDYRGLRDGELNLFVQGGPPVNLFPAAGQKVAPVNPTLVATKFPVYGVAHAASQWQVSTSTTFAAPLHDSGRRTNALTTYTLPGPGLAYPKTYYWRVRQQGADGVWTAWSAATSFQEIGPAPLRVPQQYAKIQAAIDAAGYGQEVWVSAGTYPERITMKSHIGVYGGFAGGETRRDQRNIKTHQVVLRPTLTDPGLAQEGTCVVKMDDLSSATLDGFKITAASLTLKRQDVGVKVHAIYARHLGGTNTIANCTISDFSVTMAPDGFGRVDLIHCEQASPEVRYCNVGANCSLSGLSLYGAYLLNGSDPTLTGCVFDVNFTNYGEAFHAEESGATLVNCQFLNFLGNGVVVREGRHTTMRNCLVRGNTGNGILVDGDADIRGCTIMGNGSPGQSEYWKIPALSVSRCHGTVRDCLIRDNYCNGGGLGIGGVGTTLDVLNCLITGNRNGAGIDIAIDGSTSKSTINVVNCTVAGNSGGSAGGLTCGVYVNTYPPAVRVINTLFHNNSGPVLNAAGQAKVDEVSNCLFSRNTGGVYRDDRVGLLLDAGALNANLATAHANVGGEPLFLSEPGGDWRLRNGSAALDRGWLGASVPAADIAGRARPGNDGKVDIGSFEADPAFLPGGPSLPPQSCVGALPFFTTATLVAIPYTASDPDGILSHVTSVRLFYRRDGGPWHQYGSQYGSTASPIQFKSTLAGGDGFYEFYTLATDGEGRVEDPPAAPDAGTLVASALRRGRVYVNPAAVGVPSGLDWTHAARNIDEGLRLARVIGANELWLAKGTHVLTNTLNAWSGMKVYGGFAGSELDTAQRRLADNITTLTCFNGDTVWMYMVRDVTLDGLILAGRGSVWPLNCQSSEWNNRIDNCRVMSGLGMRIQASRVALTGCFFSTYYRGMYVYDSALTLNNCTFSGEGLPLDYWGNGVRGIYCSNSDLTLDGVLFSDLSYKHDSGMAIEAEGSTLRLSGCTIRRCVAGENRFGERKPAGQDKPYSLTPYPQPPPPDPISGAGICAKGSIVRLENCLLYANAAYPVYYYTDGLPSFLRWKTPAGGAIYAGAGSALVCVNCTFSENRLYLASAGDIAEGGSAICSRGRLEVVNTIFTDNNRIAIRQGLSQPFAVRYCLFKANADGDTTGTLTESAGVVHAPAGFVSPSSRNFHVMVTSAAVDAGMRVTSPIWDLDGKQRGIKTVAEARGDGSGWDIGAYEYQSGTGGKTLRLYAPNGGETWRAGLGMDLAWWGYLGSVGPELKVELRNGKGLVATLGKVSDPRGYGFARVTLPLSTPGGKDYRIRIISTKNTYYEATSDQPFTILPKPNAVGDAGWQGYR